MTKYTFARLDNAEERLQGLWEQIEWSSQRLGWERTLTDLLAYAIREIKRLKAELKAKEKAYGQVEKSLNA